MTRSRRTRALLVGLAGVAGAASVAVPPAGAVEAAPSAEPIACSPTAADRPVCPAGADPEGANFLDPTARLQAPDRVRLEGRVYVGPFAALIATRAAGIVIGSESNVQDSVAVQAAARRSAADTARLADAGLSVTSGVETGERVILAHGSSVRGPARIGVLEPGQEAPAQDSGVFVSFGAQVDGAVLERDSGLSALSRIGPGLTLPSGLLVLPGKDVQTQAEAEDPALGKVRPLVEADRLFNAGVVEVNEGLARSYSELAEKDPSAIRGINVDPGGNSFDVESDLPTVEGALCTGPEVAVPDFRNRIIGDACFEDSLAGLDDKMGERISIRADEGGPFGIGTIASMGNAVVFHALEGTDLEVGDRIQYGPGAIVHGGGRPTLDPTTQLAAPTVIGNDVRLGANAVVFRSLVKNGAVLGRKSLVVGSQLEIGQVIPARTIFANDKVFGPVEW